jgi:hypothetical protein
VGLANDPGVSVNITKPNAADCPGRWVVHEVDGYLYSPVSDPLQVSCPAARTVIVGALAAVNAVRSAARHAAFRTQRWR